MTEAKSKSINPVDFDVTKLINTPVDTSEKASKFQKTQYLSFTRYEDEKNPFLFKIGKTRFTEGGIPPIHKDFAPDDSKRGYFKYSNDPNQKVCGEVFNMLKEIDTHLGSSDFKKKLLSFDDKLKKSADKFDYSPLVRKPGEESKAKYEFTKVKLPSDFEKKELKTVLYYGKEEKDSDGKLVSRPKRVKASTITELNEYFNFQCEAQFVVSLSKIWIAKSPGVGGKRLYGATLECKQINVMEKGDSKGNTSFEEFAFGDGEEVVSLSKKQATKNEESTEEHKGGNTKEDVDSDEENKSSSKKAHNDEDAEEDEEEEKTSKKKKDDDDDDEEEEEEEVKPKAKSKTKSKKSKNSDDEEEESESEKPVKKSFTKAPRK
jgi:hypothetical protein